MIWEISATATLTTSYVGRPCPGELVTFTCTVPGVEVFWDPGGENRISINILSTTSITEGLFTATLLSSNATSITSTLLTTARDDVTVECLTVGSVTIQVAGMKQLLAKTPDSFLLIDGLVYSFIISV